MTICVINHENGLKLIKIIKNRTQYFYFSNWLNGKLSYCMIYCVHCSDDVLI